MPRARRRPNADESLTRDTMFPRRNHVPPRGVGASRLLKKPRTGYPRSGCGFFGSLLDEGRWSGMDLIEKGETRRMLPSTRRETP